MSRPDGLPLHGENFDYALSDIHIDRRNVADLTQYLDDQAAQLAMCAGAEEDNVPLTTVETFPRITGGVRAILDSTPR